MPLDPRISLVALIVLGALSWITPVLLGFGLFARKQEWLARWLKLSRLCFGVALVAAFVFLLCGLWDNQQLGTAADKLHTPKDRERLVEVRITDATVLVVTTLALVSFPSLTFAVLKVRWRRLSSTIAQSRLKGEQ